MQARFTENKGEKLTYTDVHLIQGVHLIWGPLNTGFTVFEQKIIHHPQSY